MFCGNIIACNLKLDKKLRRFRVFICTFVFKFRFNLFLNIRVVGKISKTIFRNARYFTVVYAQEMLFTRTVVYA